MAVLTWSGTPAVHHPEVAALASLFAGGAYEALLLSMYVHIPLLAACMPHKRSHIASACLILQH